jgi:hypothetical protein
MFFRFLLRLEWFSCWIKSSCNSTNLFLNSFSFFSERLILFGLGRYFCTDYRILRGFDFLTVCREFPLLLCQNTSDKSVLFVDNLLSIVRDLGDISDLYFMSESTLKMSLKTFENHDRLMSDSLLSLFLLFMTKIFSFSLKFVLRLLLPLFTNNSSPIKHLFVFNSALIHLTSLQSKSKVSFTILSLYFSPFDLCIHFLLFC